ncbi:hypothetical protein QQ045_003816 [Rhodiola kirilowii]
MRSFEPLWTWWQPWIRDYERLQSLAVILIYIQIGCALVGSVGALYNGLPLINLAVALFGLVAIESLNQILCRTYATLLACTILLDIIWLILFSGDIWNISSETYGTYVIFSVRVTLAMQCIAFSVRLASSLLWIQMYRLGVSDINRAPRSESVADLRNSFLSPSPEFPVAGRRISDTDEHGPLVHDQNYFSSLFEDGQDNGCMDLVTPDDIINASRLPPKEGIDG